VFYIKKECGKSHKDSPKTLQTNMSMLRAEILRWLHQGTFHAKERRGRMKIESKQIWMDWICNEMYIVRIKMLR
jgi:hypothetical protein